MSGNRDIEPIWNALQGSGGWQGDTGANARPPSECQNHLGLYPERKREGIRRLVVDPS